MVKPEKFLEKSQAFLDVKKWESALGMEEELAVLKEIFTRLIFEEMSEDFEDLCREHMTRCAARAKGWFASNASEGNAGAGQIEENRFKLPRLELTKFDLCPKTYIAFWAQFKLIAQDDRLRAEEKLQYLLNTLLPNTRARRIVESFPPSKENYEKALASLKNRFGRDSMIIEAYTKDLLELVMTSKKPSLSNLYDMLNSKIQALASLGVTTDNVSAVLYPLVLSTLPPEIVIEWERKRRPPETVESGYDEETMSIGAGSIANVLDELLSFLEQEVMAEERCAANVKKASLNSGSSKQFKENEPRATAAALVACEKAKAKCIFCSGEHDSQECKKTLTIEERKAKIKQNRRCLQCFKFGHFANKCRAQVTCSRCKGEHNRLLCEVESQVALHAGQLKDEVYLKTVMVKFGNRPVRVLFDDGSARSYISEQLAKDLSLNAVGKEYTSHSLFGGVVTKGRDHKVYEIELDKTKLTCLAVPQICCEIPRVSNKALLKTLKNHDIILSDVGAGCPRIDILIGAQGLGLLMTGNCVVLNGVTAIETKIGWTVLGSVERSSSTPGEISLFAMDNFWKLEALGVEDPSSNDVLDWEAEEHFRETIRVNADNRYEVRLPWKAGHPTLEDNKAAAEFRLKSVYRRLGHDDAAKYNQVFDQWEEMGIIERVEHEGPKKVHYLPHRPVFKESSSTPCRPVFDASAKTKGVSLNDCLNTGPNLIEKIPAMMVNFRKGKFGVTADIKSAFLQMSVCPEDRDSLRFLRWKDGKISEYRHTRVVFGVNCSPFLLNATIRHHLDGMVEDATVLKMRKSFYVDDLVTSVDSSQEAENLVVNASAIMVTRHFELCKWAYSGQEGERKILGTNWDMHMDVLYCVSPEIEVGNVLTKRVLLSIVSRVYDPIGILNPAMVTLKVLLQEAWRANVSWDDPLPEVISQPFAKWALSWSDLSKIRLSRWVHLEAGCCEIHVFADGSGKAYACCIYVRCVANGVPKTTLLASKARVAPKTGLTIPRTELMAALIAVRLVNSLSIPKDIPVIFYSDSTVVLAWVTKPNLWKTWVGNRVKEIQGNTTAVQWRHVSGTQNPADLPSRGCDFRYLIESEWLSGPRWLAGPESEWPCRQVSAELPDEALKEEITLCTVESEPFSSKLAYFSSYYKMWRMVAWMVRFVQRASQVSRNEGPLTFDELDLAEKCIFRVVQREGLQENKYPNLQMKQCPDGLVRVQTRLSLMPDVDEEFVNPIVLVDHPIVRRLIEQFHRKMSHAGVSTILAKMRERVWLLRGRQVVRKVVASCVICKRFSAKNVLTKTAPLPVERIAKNVVFGVTGVDLAGPLFLKSGEKVWIALFTCAVYRAVHLELVSSLSTETFLMALRRFIARRGRCRVLWSDQGTNFKGAANLLSQIDWDTVVNEMSLRKIEWKFNPAAAPWWGGWWERMVGVVKNCLKKVLGRASLSYEELGTVLVDCESTVNQRPLTYVSSEKDELIPLTPFDFLCDGATPLVVDLDEIDRTALVKRLSHVQKVRLDLRKRFQSEYIGALGARPQSERGSVKPGDIVLVGADNLKKVMWPLARVVSLIPGKDGVVRAVKLALQGGELIRPVQRVYPLEIPNEMASEKTGIVETENVEFADTHSVMSDEANNEIDVEPVDYVEVVEPVRCTRRGRVVTKPKRYE